jgi:nitrogen fixation-related uncharacterized protein
METLVQRIRLAMNLTLVASLLLFWGLSSGRPDDVLGLGMEILDRTRSLEYLTTGRIPNKSTVPDTFAEIYELEDSDVSVSRETLLRWTPVKDLLRMRYHLHPSLMQDLLERGEPSRAVSEAIEDFKRLELAHERLRQIYGRSRLDADATLGQLIDYTQTGVRIPIINEQVHMESAFRLFAIGATGVLLYLLSCLKALGYMAKSEGGGKGRDWVFFHPGWLGLFIGSVWVLAPAGVAFLSLWVKVGEPFPAIAWMLTLALLGGAIIWRSFRIRQFVLRRADLSSEQ